MAIGLQNQQNISTPNSTYPDGDIKDNLGDNLGTPFDKAVYADYHQTMAKLLRMANITPNGLYENETNGFQYIQAMRKCFVSPSQIITFNRATSGILSSNYSALVRTLAADSGLGNLTLPDLTAVIDLVPFTFINGSANSWTLTTFDSSQTLDAPAMYTYIMPTTKMVELVPDVTNLNWIITEKT